MPDDIPAAVALLVGEHIRSIAQLELLLLMHARPESSWTIEQAAKELYTAASMTEPLLETLRSSGLVARSEEAERRYRYGPRSPEVAGAVDELAKLYHQRRVTIINLIYAAPVKNLQNFADAFRIRKNEEDK